VLGYPRISEALRAYTECGVKPILGLTGLH